MVEKMKGSKLLSAWAELRKSLQSYVKGQNLSGLETKIKALVARTQREIKSFDLHFDKNDLNVEANLKKLRTKINKEKAQVEKFLNNFVKKEMKRAKKFVDAQKKEISKLQKKFEALALKGGKKRKAKKATKKVARKTTSRKKASSTQTVTGKTSTTNA